MLKFQIDLDQHDVSDYVEFKLYNQVDSEINIFSTSLRMTTMTDIYVDLDNSFLICNLSRREMEHNIENILWLKFILDKIINEENL